jgi:hypothetical protein
MHLMGDIVKEMRSRDRDPHGWWILGDHVLNLYIPYWTPGGGDDKVATTRFTGPISDDYYEFHKVTNRRHGYWTLSQDNWVCCYSPNYCVHLGYDAEHLATCDVYATRPRICSAYFCGRHLEGIK